MQTFTTSFTFQLSECLGRRHDVCDSGRRIFGRWAILAEGLAYQGIANSVAVKFDLYNNSGEGNDSTGLYTDGAVPTVPAVDLSSTGSTCTAATSWPCNWSITGPHLTMTLTDTVTNATVTEIFTVNIPSIVGGNTAYVGFTGATGGLSAAQNVLSWTYTSP